MLSAPSRPIPSSSPSPQSQPRPSNPLADLIQSEKAYIDILKLIDSQIAPIWMKQTTSAAPDFSEQLAYVHAILIVNKRFCTRLVKVAGDPRAMRELGDILMQWVEDIEIPYSNFLRNYITDIDRRTDILNNPPIRACLEHIPSASSNATKLKTLFDAPVERLRYYKGLYDRLLQASKPGRADHDLLLRTNARINALVQILEKNSNFAMPQEPGSPVLSSHGTLFAFLNRADCTGVMDFFTHSPVAYRPLPSSEANSRIILQNDLVLMSSRGSFNVHLALTPSEVALFRKRESGNPKYSLLHPPFAACEVSVKSVSIDRERDGEYLVQLHIRGSRHIILKADTRETRNAWVGASPNAPSAATLDQKPLTTVIKQQLLRIEKNETTDRDEIYALYEDEPEERHESAQKRRDAFRDTIMDLYNGRFSASPVPPPPPHPRLPPQTTPRVDQDGQDLANIAPRAVKMMPNVPVDSETAKEKQLPTAPVQMTYIQPSVHKINVDSGSPTLTTTPIILPRTSSRKNTPQQQQQQQQQPGSTMQTLRSALAVSIDSSPGSIASSEYSVLRDDTSSVSSFPQQLPNSQSPSLRSPYNDRSMAPATVRGVPAYTIPPKRQGSLSNSVRSVDSGHSPIMKPISALPNSAPIGIASGGRISPGPLPRIDSYNVSSQFSDYGSPPQSPGAFANATRKIVYSHSECEVFHWKDQTWYSAQGKCSIQVRITNANRFCVSIQLLNTGQLYLNAWILPNASIQRTSDTDVSLSVIMGVQKETYLIHMDHRQDAVQLYNALQYVFEEAVRILSPPPPPPPQSPPYMARNRVESMLPPDSKTSREEAPQSLKPMFQCRCKLFAQQEHATWNSLGGVTIRISLQVPSNKMHVYIENGKTKLVSSIVQSCNVEKTGAKRLTFLLITDKSSMVYMINLKDEQTTNKIYQYIKIDNARNGW